MLALGGHQILRSLTFHLWTFSHLDLKAAGGEEIGMTELAERCSLCSISHKDSHFINQNEMVLSSAC